MTGVRVPCRASRYVEAAERSVGDNQEKRNERRFKVCRFFFFFEVLFSMPADLYIHFLHKTASCAVYCTRVLYDSFEGPDLMVYETVDCSKMNEIYSTVVVSLALVALEKKNARRDAEGSRSPLYKQVLVNLCGFQKNTNYVQEFIQYSMTWPPPRSEGRYLVSARSPARLVCPLPSPRVKRAVREVYPPLITHEVSVNHHPREQHVAGAGAGDARGEA